MAKKKRATKHSTKVSKRRATKRVATKRKSAAFQPGAFQPGAFQGLPPSASQRELSPAVQSTVGGVNPPLALSAGSEAKDEGAGGVAVDDSKVFVIPPPIPITPTVYPDDRDGTVIVHNHVTINIESIEFKTFNATMDSLVKQVGKSNNISGEVSAQLLSEMTAGRDLLKGPKPSRDLIQLLLVKPLEFLLKTAAGTIIGTLAGQALDLLLKIIM